MQTKFHQDRIDKNSSHTKLVINFLFIHVWVHVNVDEISESRFQDKFSIGHIYNKYIEVFCEEDQ